MFISILKVLFLIWILLLIIIELSIISVYGWFLSDKTIKHILDKFKGKMSLYDNIIILEKSALYISDSGDTLLSKYSIGNLGRVPKWSKYHEIIENLYMKLYLN